uniref:C2H2-type domain-containing protein n=1 Tax=Oreochromis aureus TaxID=47969 RepID=A0A668RG26_OREAU
MKSCGLSLVFKCFLCKFTTNLLKSLKEHYKAKHATYEDKSYACPENLFYCHKCNFGNPSIKGVINHQAKVHRKCNSSTKCVLEYTALIHDEIRKAKANAKDSSSSHLPLPIINEGEEKRHSKSLRSLNCNTCGYNTDVIYALKKHLSKTHKVKRTVTDILRYYFRQGSLEPGHYCEFCVFRHEKAAVVYEHYQERHLGRVPSVEYVSTWLYAGPGMVLPKKKKPNLEQTGLSCKRCSFKSKSLSDLAHHYRIVHPLGPKPAKKANTSWRVEDQSDRPGSSDSYQVTLEFGKSRDEAEASSTVFKCIYCSANFSSQHGLQIHCGMKHPEFVIEKYEEQQKPKKQLQKPKKQLQKRLHVFKCPYCTYVNTIYQGVLTHCQMKHPNLPSRANSLHVDMVYVENLDKTWKSSPPGESLKLCGHMCKTCPQICATLEKLNKHCERDHKKTGASTAQSTAKPAPKPLVKSKTLVSKAYSTHGSVSKTSFLSKKIYAVINCQHCSYTCTTKFALGRHLLANHKHTISKDCVYKCVLCSKVYFRKKHLGGHYAVTHGKEAYLKYYVPVYKQALKKTAPSPSEDPSTQQQENASETFKSSITLYKCQMCTYKGLYRKYLQCHYKNTHKLDAVSIYKLLEKYNKRKWNFPSNMLKSGNSTKVKCLKCPDLTFESSQLLIDHYSTFHRSEWKLDFTVLSLGSPKKKTTGVYKCDHCNTQLNGIRKVCYHMDRHRARMLEMAKAAQRKESLVSTTIEQESSEVNETATLETVNKVNRWNGTPVPSAAFPAIPPQSPSELSDVQQPELESNEDKHTCKQCGRMFMSLKGLHSHEHSHAALAAIKKLDNSSTSGLKHNKYLIHKSGTLRPFLCSCCTYRTTVFGLWRSHFMKNFWFCSSTNRLWVLETLTGSLYLEPPDVRRQLNHYTMMAQSSIKSKVNVQLSKLPENSVLHCEICNFSTGHLSSIRRHYLNRHGKKIFRCKDCNFFTGLRKTLEMHMETGHSTCQSKPTHQKDLCCPFCLYQTKNKNNMIDHIVLHREERVVPIEVRRPKLSRYLQGIIFRCHKCTFTSGSPENLRLHMMRHDDIKPYKCRLCYFDCTRLSDLEAHLSDKHQVVRNHELVGQVSLDQLEASVEPAEVLCSSLTEQKRFTCEFCGRNLVNSSELKRHVMRHGI